MAGLIVVDASCLYEVVTNTELGERIGDVLTTAGYLAAPHVVDVEVAGVVRGDVLAGLLDETAGRQAIEDLATWPGDRYVIRPFLDRVWELRHSVRTWDACYVALAEALGATLLTRDGRLAKAHGPQCQITVPE